MSRDAVDAEITLVEAKLVPGGRATLRFRTTAHRPVRIRGAHAHFVGYEETKAVYTTSDSKTTRTHTATERNVLVEERKTFQGRAPAGCCHCSLSSADLPRACKTDRRLAVCATWTSSRALAASLEPGARPAALLKAARAALKRFSSRAR